MQETKNTLVNNAEILFLLKKKEAEVTELLKIKKKYEYELSALNEKYIEKEYRLKRTEEEYLKLKNKLKEINLASGNNEELNFSSEIIKQKEEIRRLKEKIRENDKNAKELLDSETRKLFHRLLESERKFKVLSNSITPENNTKQELTEKNIEISQNLDNSVKKTNELEAELKNLKEDLLNVKHENDYLLEENTRLERKTASPNIIRIKNEIEYIYKITHENFLALEGLKSRKEISSIFLSFKTYSDPDVFNTLNATKDTVTQMKKLLIDINAEACEVSECNNQ